MYIKLLECNKYFKKINIFKLPLFFENLLGTHLLIPTYTPD